ncbi:hypothetical protein DIPPA_07175 [Diplonema papillatum]|nr:hypothetical protein DIPPA_07175 [Diplonema papillatum]
MVGPGPPPRRVQGRDIQHDPAATSRGIGLTSRQILMMIALATTCSLYAQQAESPVGFKGHVVDAVVANTTARSVIDDATARASAHLESLGVRIKSKDKWYLGVCSATRSSGAWLREWIELLILAGVDHLWLVNDNDEDTEDGTQAIMEFYERLGFLTILPGPLPKTHPGCRPVAGKAASAGDCVAPKYCAERVGEQVQYLIFADSDEFLFPRQGCSLSDFVERTCDPKRAAWHLAWERFGTSGLAQQPAGLMAENFLASGGDCSALKHPAYAALRARCEEGPFSSCGECRGVKLLLNTRRCVTPDHVADAHQLANTSAWKADPTTGQRWENSPGPGTLPFKQADCEDVPREAAGGMCAEGLGTADAPYGGGCCSMGIGYNYYGAKAVSHFHHTQQRRGAARPVELGVVDLNDFISPSILRFVRALRSRFTQMGLAPSIENSFLDVRYGTAKGTLDGTCFVESDRRYKAAGSNNGTHASAAPLNSGLRNPTPAKCCSMCFVVSQCAAWTIEDGRCSLLFASGVVAEGRMQPTPRSLRKLIEAHREESTGSVAGIVIRDECRRPR